MLTPIEVTVLFLNLLLLGAFFAAGLKARSFVSGEMVIVCEVQWPIALPFNRRSKSEPLMHFSIIALLIFKLLIFVS